MPHYIISHTQGHKRLVIAPNAAQAIRHVVQSEFKAKVATTDEALKLLAAGVKVEAVGDPEPEPEVAPLPPRTGPPPTPSEPIGAPGPGDPANAPHR